MGVLVVPIGLSGWRKELNVPVPGYWVSTAACSCLSWLSVMGHLSQLANRLLRKWSPSHGAGLRGCCRTFFFTHLLTHDFRQSQCFGQQHIEPLLPSAG